MEPAMAKEPQDKTLDELMQDMCTREDCLEHLTAKAEMVRRDAAQKERNNRYLLASVVIAAIAACASAFSAYFAYLSVHH
jgi:hypothetical protein